MLVPLSLKGFLVIIGWFFVVIGCIYAEAIGKAQNYLRKTNK